ncbi:MAG: TetR-like C-terminal domain-containing protein [Faecalibacterium sp.]
MDWIMVDDAQQAMEGRKKTSTTGIKRSLDVLLKIQENKLLVLNVYRSISQEQVEQYLYKLVDPLLHEFVDKETQGHLHSRMRTQTVRR